MADSPYIVEANGVQIHGIMDAPSVQIDGLSQILVGSPLVKMIFHQVIAPGNEAAGTPEIRKACLIFTLPIGEAVQMAQTILQTVKNGQDDIEKMQSEHDARLKGLMDGLTIVSQSKN